MKRLKGAFRPICTIPAMQKPVRTKKERHPEMTYKEAIDYLINGISDEAIDIAIDCIEKRIPKKPNAGAVFYRCPNCGHERPVQRPHCEHCGQAIDWSDEE